MGNSVSIYKLKGDQRADLTSSFGLHMYTTTNVHAFAHTVLPQTYEHPYTRPHILHIYTRKKEKDKRQRNIERPMPGAPLQKGASPSADILETEPKGRMAKVCAAKLRPSVFNKG